MTTLLHLSARAGHRMPMRTQLTTRGIGSSTSAPKAKAKATADTVETRAPVQTKSASPLRAFLDGRLMRMIKYPWSLYTKAQTARPYVTQIASANVIYFLGDFASQIIQSRVSGAENKGESPEETTFNYDPKRSVRAIVIGSGSAIPSYHWFIYLGTMFPGYSRYVRLALQVTTNQVVFGPLFSVYFFGMQSFLTGNGGPSLAGLASAAYHRVAETLPTSWINGFKFWPAVMAVNLAIIPPQNRSIFAGAAAIGWQTYLGLLNQRARQKELSLIKADLA